jgi:hypothetical protein
MIHSLADSSTDDTPIFHISGQRGIEIVGGIGEMFAAFFSRRVQGCGG